MQAPHIEPMLASSGRPTGPLDRWRIEPKLDGWRAVVTMTEGRVRVRSRRGNDLTHAVPELSALAGRGDLVLDGELVVGAGRLVDFYRLAGRMSAGRRSATPVTFVAFDVLWRDGELLTSRSWRDRRAVLVDLDLPDGSLVPSYDGEALDDVVETCEQLGMEGIVAKRVDAPYRPGARTTTWSKVKCPSWAAHAERRRPDKPSR